MTGDRICHQPAGRPLGAGLVVGLISGPSLAGSEWITGIGDVVCLLGQLGMGFWIGHLDASVDLAVDALFSSFLGGYGLEVPRLVQFLGENISTPPM